MKANKLGTGTAIGFLAGSFVGVIMGILTNELALWLSIGTGAGLTFGVVIGLLLNSRK